MKFVKVMHTNQPLFWEVHGNLILSLVNGIDTGGLVCWGKTSHLQQAQWQDWGFQPRLGWPCCHLPRTHAAQLHTASALTMASKSAILATQPIAARDNTRDRGWRAGTVNSTKWCSCQQFQPCSAVCMACQYGHAVLYILSRGQWILCKVCK